MDEIKELWACLHCGNVQYSLWRPTHCLVCKSPTTDRFEVIPLK